MKKYETALYTRMPEVLISSMKEVCEEFSIRQSDLVRKSIATEIQRIEAAGRVNRLDYM